MCAKQKVKAVDGFEPIRALVKDNNISQKEISEFAQIDYPLFSFRYLQPNSIKNCTQPDFFYDFLMRLNELSSNGWDKIRSSRRHDLGMESIPCNQFKPNLKILGDTLTDDIKKLHVFRADNKNHSFVGLQVGKVFHIFFIEAEFGDIYSHGKKK